MLIAPNRKKICRNVLAVSVVGVCLAGIAGAPAHAIETKVFPGSMCVRWAGPGLTVEPLNFSSIYNPSATVTMRVDCPIVKERPFTGLSVARPDTIDRHPNLGVSCQLVTARRVGGAFVSAVGPVVTSVGNNANPQFLNGLAPVNPANGFAVNWAHWYLSCSIPPTSAGLTSHIINYYVDEL